ncbi:MAG: hypothetical protein P8J18_02230 [Halieaceae bacterium]|nr:hypothetical protein [Halieaceae bacterium]
MPEMTMLGWFHTVLGAVAVLSGFYTLYLYRLISMKERSGRLYVNVTLLVAGSALGIYNQGGFGIAHMLAVLTLIALTAGVIMEKFEPFGSFSKYFQALGYSGTLLFHMIPAITDFLRRLPVGDPFVDSIEDPLLINFQLTFLLIFVAGIIAQTFWLKKHENIKNDSRI